MRSKFIAGSIGLIGYGALIGWALTADNYERKMKSNQQVLGEIIDRQARELSAAKDAVMQNYADRDSRPSELMHKAGVDTIITEPSLDFIDIEPGEPLKNETITTHAKLKDREEEGFDQEGYDAARTNLQNLINEYTTDPDDRNNFAERGARMEADHTPPFVISKEKFAWDEDEGDEYDKITLTYYQRERLLLDDEEDVVEDVANLVGWKNLSRFGDESGDAEVVYIRNRRLSTDFEVVRDTENLPPAHVRFGMGREEFETHKAAGLIRFRPGDV